MKTNPYYVKQVILFSFVDSFRVGEHIAELTWLLVCQCPKIFLI